MIDIKSEELITLPKAAADYVPRRRQGRKVSTSTMYRWSNPGIRGVRLETIRVAGSLCTSVEALQRFFDALTALDSDSSSDAIDDDDTDPSIDRALAKYGL